MTTRAQELLKVAANFRNLAPDRMEIVFARLSEVDKDALALALKFSKQPQELIDQAIRENWSMASLVDVLVNRDKP